MTLTTSEEISMFLCSAEQGEYFDVNQGQVQFHVVSSWTTANTEALDKNKKLKVKDQNKRTYWIYFNRRDQSQCMIVTDYDGDINPPIEKIQSITPDPTVTIIEDFSD